MSPSDSFAPVTAMVRAVDFAPSSVPRMRIGSRIRFPFWVSMVDIQKSHLCVNVFPPRDASDRIPMPELYRGGADDVLGMSFAVCIVKLNRAVPLHINQNFDHVLWKSVPL